MQIVLHLYKVVNWIFHSSINQMDLRPIIGGIPIYHDYKNRRTIKDKIAFRKYKFIFAFPVFHI